MVSVKDKRESKSPLPLSAQGDAAAAAGAGAAVGGGGGGRIPNEPSNGGYHPQTNVTHKNGSHDAFGELHA